MGLVKALVCEQTRLFAELVDRVLCSANMCFMTNRVLVIPLVPVVFVSRVKQVICIIMSLLLHVTLQCNHPLVFVLFFIGVDCSFTVGVADGRADHVKH